MLSNIGHYLHKRDGEVKPLPQAPKGDEGLSGKAASCHLAKRLLVFS